MHKLALIFLLGSLVMLLPFGTNMNVMAFERDEYGYETDQYERYGMDMANDNYYKSQGNDIIKKIKCNNINSNFNEVEAIIGTDDPLGIGATSLQVDDASANAYGYGERNSNGNFDLDCINNNSNEGGQGGVTGPQGPQGLPGTPGTPGPSTITPTNVYTNVGPTFTNVFANNFLSSVAECDDGDTALSGSFITTGSGVIKSSKPLITEDGWNATAEFELIRGLGSVTADVVCFDNPPAHMSLDAADVSTFQQQPIESPVISQGTGNSPRLISVEKQPEDSP